MKTKISERLKRFVAVAKKNFQEGKTTTEESLNGIALLAFYCGRIAKEISFIFLWPVLTFVGCMVIEKFLHHKLLAEVIAFVAITSMIFYFANMQGIRYRKDFGRRLRNLLIILSGGYYFLIIANTLNLAQNNIPLPIWVIGASLLVLSYVLIIKGWGSDSHFNVRLNSRTYYEVTTALLVVPIILLFIGEIWIHFNSQFIWIPTILAVTYFSFSLYKDNRETKADFFKRRGVCFYGIPIFSALGIISTLSQFWFSKIVWGIKLWQIVSVIGGLALLFALYFLVDYLKDKKKRKLEMEEANKKEQEKKETERIEREEKLEREREKSIHRSDDIVASMSAPTWDDVIFLSKNFPDKLMFIQVEISKMQLAKLLVISDLKKQVVWDSSLIEVFQAIEKVVKKSYDDRILGSFVEQIQSFSLTMKKYSDYEGSGALESTIRKECPTLIVLGKKK